MKFPRFRIVAYALPLLLCCTRASLGQVEDQQAPVQTPAVVVNPPPPKTHLQSMAEEKGALIVCGYTDIGTLQQDNGTYVRVTAAEFTNTTTSTKTYGLLVFIHQEVGEVRSYIDADELDNLLASLDSMSHLDKTTTQLNDFDARIRTRGDLEIANINDGGARSVAFHGVEIVPTSGQEIWATTRFPLARLADFQQYLNTGKQVIEKARDSK